MAVITPTTGNYEATRGLKTTTWAAILAADTCAPVEIPHWMDRTVHVFGTFGSATVLIQGSNDPRVLSAPGSADWQTIRDPGGNNLSFNAAGLKAILELPRFIRPSTSGGDGTSSVTVVINSRGEYNR